MPAPASSQASIGETSLHRRQAQCWRARAWWLKTQHPDLALLVVDYLQLVTAGVKVERRLEVALITRRLKELAGLLAVPVIVLSQLNRELTRRSDPRLQLADLAESGAARISRRSGGNLPG